MSATDERTKTGAGHPCPVHTCPSCKRRDTFAQTGEQFIAQTRTRLRFYKCSRCGFGLTAVLREKGEE